MLPSLNLGNQLLWAREIRNLLATKFGIRFNCCPRTFSRALAAAIAHTPLLVLEGRRYRVRLGDLLLVDSELLRDTAAATPERRSPAATASTATGAPPPPAADEPATEPPSRPPSAPCEPVEFEPEAETSDPTTESADPPIGAEEEFPEHDDEAAREALPAWLTASNSDSGFRHRYTPGSRPAVRGCALACSRPSRRVGSRAKASPGDLRRADAAIGRPHVVAGQDSPEYAPESGVAKFVDTNAEAAESSELACKRYIRQALSPKCAEQTSRHRERARHGRRLRQSFDRLIALLLGPTLSIPGIHSRMFRMLWC